MNEQSNMPVSSGSSGVAGWFSTWMTAITKPNEQTYATLAEHPDAQTNNRAFIWVFLAGTVSALISGVLSGIVGLAGFSTSSALGGLGGDTGGTTIASIGISICFSPIAGAIGTLVFAIFVGITQWLAKIFKGTGTFSQLAYVMAAITVPLNVVFAFLTPFSGLPILSLCTGIISLIASLYAIYLEITAVKAVNKFGYGQAAASIFIPGLVIACCVAVVVIVMLNVLGPSIGETFNQINNNLP